MFDYVHPKMPNTTVVRAANHYSLPASVAKHLDFVAPVNRFPPVRQQVKFTAANRPNAKRPLRTNTPKTLRELYNVGTVEGKAPANKMACTAFLKQYYLKADLAKFYQKYVSTLSPPSPLTLPLHFCYLCQCMLTYAILLTSSHSFIKVLPSCCWPDRQTRRA